MAGKSTVKGSGGNGLNAFTLHKNDRASTSTMSALRAERESSPRFAFAGGATAQSLDPETIAKAYLQQALASKSAPRFTAPVVDKAESTFKSLGTESILVTGTTAVKFRQMVNDIPVYGSLVTVELDENNELLGINSSTGTPKGVSPVAKISAGQAVKSAIAHRPDYKPDLRNVTPQLKYFYDVAKSKWHLAFILEDVPVSRGKTKGRFPVRKDYVIDAHTGKVIAVINGSPTVAASITGVDCLGKNRTLQVEKHKGVSLLRDTTLNVQTFDFKGKDPTAQPNLLPGSKISNPPAFSPSAVSAHANASDVSRFMRTAIMRNNIDGKGGAMKSSINCIDVGESEGGLGKEWINAYWDGNQMVYGLRLNAGTVLSMSADLDVVAHEMFHGITDSTSRLEYRFQSGALNESYSDIFGVIVNNFAKPDLSKWIWEIGPGLQPDGRPFRNFKHPHTEGQPEHMKEFEKLPDTERGDYGGVHTNSGIHNKAAYNVLVSKDSSKSYIFTPKDVAIIFYVALTQYLSATSQFADSRRAVIQSARTYFRALPVARLNEKISAIEKAFSAVGIK